jgi:hypothetical protein
VKRVLKFFPHLLLLFGFALRLYHLGADSLWYDETVSLLLARADLAELIRHTAGDIHPPLYYVLLHFWGQFAGWSEFSAAFLSVWFGVLLIALVYRVTREWLPSPNGGGVGGEGIPALAALFVAVSPYNIWYSQEVRMYTLGAVLGLLSVYFLRRISQNAQVLTRDFFAYAIFTALGFYTLYYFVFLVAFEWLWVAARSWQMAKRKWRTANGRWRLLITDNRFLRTFLLSQLAVVILYLPWLPIAFRQVMDPPVPPWREFVGLPRMVLETLGALAFGQSVDANIFGFVALLVFVPMGILLRREWKTENRKPKTKSGDPRSAIRDTPSPVFLLGYFLVPFAAIFLFSLWKPLYHVRYMFTYSPAFYILAAYAWWNLAREFANARRVHAARWVNPLGAMAVLVSVAFFMLTGYSLYNVWHNPQYAPDDLRGAVNYIAEHWRPGDVIVVNAGYAYPALEYYYPEPITRERLVNFRGGESNAPRVLQTGSIGGANDLGWGDPLSDFYATTADETRAALDRVFADAARVWMLRIYDTVVDPDGMIRAYFDAHATMFDDQVFAGEAQTRVQGFITNPTRELPTTAARVQEAFGERVELVGYEMGARELPRGAFLDMVLYWQLRQAVNYNYQVSLQLLDANGQNVAQADEMPLSEVLPMTRWNTNALYREPLRLNIPAALAPGEYHAVVKLYNPRTGQVLGTPFAVGTVTVR